MNTEVVSGSRVHQWGGAAFVLGNVLFMVNKFDEMSRLFLGRWMPDVISGQNPALILWGQVALIIGYVAYYQFYSRRVGRQGKNALRLFSGGGIVLAFGHVGFMSVLENYLPPSILPYAESLFLLVILGLAVLAHRPDLVWHSQFAPAGIEPLALAAVGYWADGLHRIFSVQRRGSHRHLSILPHPVCAGAYRARRCIMAGKASSA